MGRLKFRFTGCLLLGLLALDAGFAKENTEPPPATASKIPVTKDSKLSLKDFPKDLKKNFLGLFSKDNLPPLLIGAGATTLSLAADDSVNDWFGYVDDDGTGREISRFSRIEELGEFWGSSLVAGSTVGISLVVGHFSSDPRLNAFSYSWAQAFTLNSLLTFGLKKVVGRTRPNNQNALSFPSGHTSNAFTFATVFHHYYGGTAGIVAYAGAILVGASRLEEGVHHFSDVVAGATLGYIVGRTVVRGTDKKKRVTWIPIVSVEDKTFGVAFQAQF